MNYFKENLFFIFLGVIAFFSVRAGNLNKEALNKYNDLRGNGMQFVENNGQVVDMKNNLRSDILYVGNGEGMKIYLRKGGISYVLSKVMQNEEQEMKNEEFRMENEKKSTIFLHRIDLDFVGSNPAATVLNSEQVEGYQNYYYAHCPKGITKAKAYNRVVYQNIYPGIDIVFYGGKQQGLKYDIIVKPGGDPNAIKIKYTGADGVEIKNAELEIKNSIGEITEAMPKVYQNINGKITDVKTKYILHEIFPGEIILNFSFSYYNFSFPLVIDPWVTYYGGSNLDRCASITTDIAGDAIITGNTVSNNFPVTGASTYSAQWDGFIVKFTNAGTRVFATYFGGTDQDYANGIYTDNSSNIIVTGGSNSINIPRKDPGSGAYFQLNYGGGGGFATGDAFLAKFTSVGILVWSTYYGGSDEDVGYDVCTDNADNIIMTGYTKSNDFPNTAGYQSGINGAQNAFVVKFNSGGVRQWATYYGGSDIDRASAIAVDASGDVFIGGSTTSINFPVLAAHQPVIGTGTSGDGFVAKLNGTNGFPVWSTYYGGDGFAGDVVYAISVDGIGNIYAGGRTSSSDNIATPLAYQTARAGSYDAFLVKFNNSGVRQWGTYLGGSSGLQDYITGIACDINNNVIVTGDTYCSNFPVSACAYQKTFGSPECQFFGTFDTAGNNICLGMLGNAASGDNETWEGMGGSLAISGCYLFINTMSSCSYPITAGAFQTQCNGQLEIDVAKLYINTCGGVTSSLNFSGTSTTLCVGQPVSYTSTYISCDASGIGYSWSFSGGTPSTSSSANPNGIIYSSPGTYNVKLMIQLPCGKDSIVKTSYITVNPCGITAFASAQDICSGNCATVSASGVGGTMPYTYKWNTGETIQTINPCPSITTTYTVTVTDGIGIIATTTVMVNVVSSISISITSASVSCNGGSNGSATVSATGGTSNYKYLWNNGSTGTNVTGLTTGSYTVVVTDTVGCTAIQTINISQPTAININPVTSDAECDASMGTATANVSGGNAPYKYIWSNGLTSNSITGLAQGNYTVTITDNNGCSKETGIIINNNPGPIANAGNNLTIMQGSVAILSGSGGISYIWNPAVGLSCSTCQSPAATLAVTTTYSLIVTDSNGCTDITTVTIIVEINCPEDELFVPNAFSPNEDGENDVLKVYSNCIQFMHFIIYDRWGEKIFETNDINKAWDGVYKGKQMETAVFTYQLSAILINSKTIIKKGDISLMK